MDDKVVGQIKVRLGVVVSKDGRDLMMDAASSVDEKQLKELGLEIKKK